MSISHTKLEFCNFADVNVISSFDWLAAIEIDYFLKYKRRRAKYGISRQVEGADDITRPHMLRRI